MGFGTYFAIYFIMWWISLFLVLPFSGKSQAEEGEVVLGTTKSAPANLKVLRIVVMNSRERIVPKRGLISSRNLCWM